MLTPSAKTRFSFPLAALLAPLLLGGAASYPSPDDVLAKAPASAWAPLDPASTLYMDLPNGRVVILLAPGFAPKTVANIKRLAAARYFDNSAIVRAQDNYVVQLSQPDKAKQATEAKLKGYAEFERPLSQSLARLPDHDTYAPITGFDGAFAAGSDGKSEWLLHCYGSVGAGRDNAPDSGSGVELYAVTGQAPRQLDRNITLVGRVVQGIELLSSLPRGGGAQGAYMGFYQSPSQYTKIKSIRLASELPPTQRLKLEYLKPGTPSFSAYVEARRDRRNNWFVRPAGAIDACNVPLPVRNTPM
ncbi:MAG TPA: peptidylprolyl isomerase [Rhizomicrobium sp.]|nr:peptidylprolyl isomerase [Rhizomicrobium sp.]